MSYLCQFIDLKIPERQSCDKNLFHNIQELPLVVEKTTPLFLYLNRDAERALSCLCAMRRNTLDRNLPTPHEDIHLKMEF